MVQSELFVISDLFVIYCMLVAHCLQQGTYFAIIFMSGTLFQIYLFMSGQV